MSSLLTYLDTGVLIAAVKGTEELSEAAMRILDDPERTFASSDFVRLETIGPTRQAGAAYAAQVAFYEEFFAAVSRWPADLKAVVEGAIHECSVSPAFLGALDALHVAAATQVGADELVTTEKPQKGICRARSIRVVSLAAGE